MPFMDPAFAVAVCRYDLSRGPLKFSVPVSPAYTSVSFYTRTDVAYYAINDRAAGRRVIELDLMTTEQRAELPEDEDITAADRLIVESPTTTGLIVIRALAPEPGLMPAARSRAGGRAMPPRSERLLRNYRALARDRDGSGHRHRRNRNPQIGGRHQRAFRAPLLQQRDRALGLDRQRRRHRHDQAFEREAIGGRRVRRASAAPSRRSGRSRRRGLSALATSAPLSTGM